MSNSLLPHRVQHTRLPCPSLSPRVCSNSHPLRQWCHPTMLSCAAPFFSCFHLSQHQGLFQWIGSLHQVAKVLGITWRQTTLWPPELAKRFRLCLLSFYPLASFQGGACVGLCPCACVHMSMWSDLGGKKEEKQTWHGLEEKLSGNLEERESRGCNRRELRRIESECKSGGATLIP